MEIEAANPADCWKAAASHLIENGLEDFNLVAKFSALAATDESPMESFNPRSLDPSADDIFDVANTIFPAKTHQNATKNNLSRQEFYERYLRAHRRARRRSWGTYFERFIRLGDSGVNQLELVIKKRTAWPGNPRAALYMHTTSMEIDRPQTRGGPCLQF